MSIPSIPVRSTTLSSPFVGEVVEAGANTLTGGAGLPPDPGPSCTNKKHAETKTTGGGGRGEGGGGEAKQKTVNISENISENW